MPGVIRTRVGYAGGTTSLPAYNNIGDHTEVLEVDFNAEKISYTEILDVFFVNAHATYLPYSRQYMSILLYHDEKQKELAFQAIEKWNEQLRGEIQTALLPYTAFFLAEDYHQKYYLRMRRKLMQDLQAFVTDDRKAFIHSPLTAKLNALSGGYGTANDFKKQLDDWSLPAGNYEKVLTLLQKHEF